MAAQIDLDRGREPAQVIILAARHEEGGLGQVVLRRDRLHRRIGDPTVQRADGGGVAAEDAVGESVDLIQWDPHRFLLDPPPVRRASGYAVRHERPPRVYLVPWSVAPTIPRRDSDTPLALCVGT